MVACSEQVEQQTMQDGEHQGGSGLPATGVGFMRFITAGGLKAARVDGCVPASAASPGPMIEEADDQRQPVSDPVPGTARVPSLIALE